MDSHHLQRRIKAPTFSVQGSLRSGPMPFCPCLSLSSFCNTQLFTILSHITFASLCFSFLHETPFLSFLLGKIIYSGLCLTKLLTLPIMLGHLWRKKAFADPTIVLNVLSLYSPNILWVSKNFNTFHFICRLYVYLFISHINSLNRERLDQIIIIFVSLVLIPGLDCFFLLFK